jgi:hypothetical protein
MLDRQFEKAANEFLLLSRNSDDAVVAGLASFFLNDTLCRALPARNIELKEAASIGGERVKKALKEKDRWVKETSKLCTEIHAAALSKYMEQAGDFIFGV